VRSSDDMRRADAPTEGAPAATVKGVASESPANAPAEGASAEHAHGEEAAAKASANTHAAHLIEFDDVSYLYDGDILALDHVSFTVDAGEMIALTGPNGCGKSTALRVMNGLAFPAGGTYRFDGTVIDAQTMKDALFAKRFHQRIGFVFQNSDTQLFCPSVGEEIAFGPRQMGLSDEEVQRRTDDMLELFGLQDLRDRAPYNLSGGEKHKLAMACIVSMNPDALVLDEPTNHLDEDSQAWTVAFLRSLAQAGKTVLVTTHHRDMIAALGAREIHMDKHHHVVE
jgi:cobalt/nickel transport system ATP-binding protein